MDRLSSEELNVREARYRFEEAMDELSIRSWVRQHPLASTGTLLVGGYLTRRWLKTPYSIATLLGLVNNLVRKL